MKNDTTHRNDTSSVEVTSIDPDAEPRVGAVADWTAWRTGSGLASFIDPIRRRTRRLGVGAPGRVAAALDRCARRLEAPW